MTADLRQAISRYADVHADADGFATAPVAGVGMMRTCAPTGIMHAIYKPLLCLVVQGAKQVVAEGAVHHFAAWQSLIVSVDLPILGRVVRASRVEPFLSVALDLDMGVMREVMGQVAVAAGPSPGRDPPAVSSPAVNSSVFVDETDAAVADCALRLVRLLDRPEAAAVLRPAIITELHYWLLAGRHGAALRRLALPGSHAQRITRAVALLRAEFARPIPVGRLAAAAGMSASSFHQHFKAVTSLSPLQFQK